LEIFFAMLNSLAPRTAMLAENN